MKKTFWAGSLLLMAGLAACDSFGGPEPEEPNLLAENSVWVVCEGNFSDADGDISVYFPGEDSTVVAAYEAINGFPYAGTLQSVTFEGDTAFLIDNAGARITTVVANTMESVRERSYDWDIPRYMAVSGANGFASVWGPYDQNYNSPESFVAVLDMTLGGLWGESIDMPSRPEQVIEAGGRIWVSCSAGASLVSINPTSAQVMSTVQSLSGVSAMAVDANGKLWVVSTSEGFNGSFSGALLRYNPEADSNLEQSYNLETPGSPVGTLALDGAGTTLYYIEQEYQPDYSTISKVYAMPIGASTAPTTPLIEGTNFSAVGVHPVSGEIYVADNQAFQAAGRVIRYSAQGDSLGSFAVGRGPNAFHFRVDE